MEYWSEDLVYLRYAMGNLSSRDGEITHDHNLLDRDEPMRESAVTPRHADLNRPFA